MPLCLIQPVALAEYVERGAQLVAKNLGLTTVNPELCEECTIQQRSYGFVAALVHGLGLYEKVKRLLERVTACV